VVTVGATEFKQELEIGWPFIAYGTIEKEYEAVWMHVGIIQHDDNDTLTGAAYGIGAANIRDKDFQTGQEIRDPATGDLLDTWSMDLQRDSEHPDLHPGPATGFVLAQLKGGKLTGWLHHGIELKSGNH